MTDRAMRVAVVTCETLRVLEPDDQLLLDALIAQGLEARAEVWTDASVDWSAYDRVLIRSPWDYTDDHEAFLAWATRVAAVSTLRNPLDLITWNTNKTYLRDLQAAGIPITPTDFVATTAELDAWSAPKGCSTFVVKPSVSAGSKDTIRVPVDAEGVDRARAHIAMLIQQGKTAMVQPYLDSVDELGETALIYIDGAFSHAIRKGPLLSLDGTGEQVDGLYLKEQIDPRTAGEDERALAERILDTVPGGRPLYARVDLVRLADGSPVLLELELCEPSLFFAHGAGAAAALATALVHS